MEAAESTAAKSQELAAVRHHVHREAAGSPRTAQLPSQALSGRLRFTQAGFGSIPRLSSRRIAQMVEST
jgi:hypothetical protein